MLLKKDQSIDRYFHSLVRKVLSFQQLPQDLHAVKSFVIAPDSVIVYMYKEICSVITSHLDETKSALFTFVRI